MSDLDIDKKYPISEIKRLSTKYGEKIIVELEDGSVISLPQRCVNRASDYLKLNDIIPLYFVYLGSKDTGVQSHEFMWNKNSSTSLLQHGSEGVLSFRCKLDLELGNLLFFDGIMNHEVYLNILKRNFKLSAKNLDTGNDAKRNALKLHHWCLCNCPHSMKTGLQKF
ncbi:uncharacterized protein TNCV_4503601 [Trichonephila clavipes]|nr:uncharacterized protein TNCV_4503601 [Trichonephila clavipes]